MRGSRVLEAILRLRASLDDIAEALSSPDTARLIAAEANLAHALFEVGTIRGVDRSDRHAIAAEAIRARAALSRCRVLGAAATDVTRATLAAQGRVGGYGPSGGISPSAPLRGRDFNTRI